MTTSMQVKATRSDQVPFLSPSLPPRFLASTSPCKSGICVDSFGFYGTFVPLKSICLPGSYVASCQTWRDWLLKIKVCITCLRGHHCNHPHHSNDVLHAAVEFWDSSHFFLCVCVTLWVTSEAQLDTVCEREPLWLFGWKKPCRVGSGDGD